MEREDEVGMFLRDVEEAGKILGKIFMGKIFLKI